MEVKYNAPIDILLSLLIAYQKSFEVINQNQMFCPARGILHDQHIILYFPHCALHYYECKFKT